MRVVVVCGATGQQGARVLETLGRHGRFRPVAISRQPSRAPARALAARGFEVRRADLMDVTSLARAFEGAHGVFGVTQPWTPDYTRADVGTELTQGRNLVEASRRAGVAHLVVSTAMRLDDRPTGVPHVDSKMAIERAVEASGVPWTVLRPGTFMDNIGRSFFPVRRGVVRGFVPGDVRMPYVSCRDIGEAAARVFEGGAPWFGRGVNLMADFVSGDELGATLGRIRRERIRYEAPPALLLRVAAPEFFEMRRGFEKAGRPPYPHRAAFDAALEATRGLVGDVWCLERYFEETGYADRAFER